MPEGPDDHPGNLALREAFAVQLADLEANRRGMATAGQKRRLLASCAVALVMLVPLSFGLGAGIVAMRAVPHFGGIVVWLVAIAVEVSLVRVVFQTVVDAVRGEVVSGTDVVNPFPDGKNAVSALVGGMRFAFYDYQAEALQPNVRYRVYAFKRTGQAISAELGDTPSGPRPQ